MRIEDIRRNVPAGGEHYDVIVAGGGPAGLGAAWASAREGARTLLLEGRSFFGGVAQLGLWMPMNRLFDGTASRGGVHEAFVSLLRAYGEDAAVRGIDNIYAKDGLDIHPDYLRLVAYELLESVGCHYRIYSPVTDVVVEERRVTGLVCSGKGGPTTFHDDVVIDATGDGDVAYLSGVTMAQGSEADGRLMPVSLSFALGDCDAEAALDYINTPFCKEAFTRILEQAREKGYQTAQWYYFDRTTVPGVLSVNNGGPAESWEDSLDGTSVQDLSIADRIGVRIAADFVRLCHDFEIPGLEQCVLLRIGPHVGVRETRRTQGEYVYREKDAVEGTPFDDVILLRYGEVIDGQYFTGDIVSGHQFPYRCLLPVEIDNLLVAGRCASLSHVAHAAARSMGNMMGMGQAAGLAAAISARDGVMPRRVDVSTIQRALLAMGVDLGPDVKP